MVNIFKKNTIEFSNLDDSTIYVLSQNFLYVKIMLVYMDNHSVDEDTFVLCLAILMHCNNIANSLLKNKKNITPAQTKFLADIIYTYNVYNGLIIKKGLHLDDEIIITKL